MGLLKIKYLKWLSRNDIQSYLTLWLSLLEAIMSAFESQ